MKIVILFYLMILSIWDCKERRVPLSWLTVGTILLSGMGICKCLQRECQWTELLVGMLPGVMLTAVAWVTKKAGYADGIVLMQLGMFFGYRESMFLLCTGLILLSLVSVVLLCLRKVQRNTGMPYLPFLSAAFLLRHFLIS